YIVSEDTQLDRNRSNRSKDKEKDIKQEQNKGKKEWLQLKHRTAVSDVPYALCAFKGRLLAGVGKSLILFDFGMQKLLQKCANRGFPNFIVSISPLDDGSSGQGDRLVVCDISESFHIVRLRRDVNQFEIVADTTFPRYVVSHTVLDCDTVAGCDRFGQFFVERLSDEDGQDIEDGLIEVVGVPIGSDQSNSTNGIQSSSLTLNRGQLNGAQFKTQSLCEYYLGESATAMCRSPLQPGGADCIVYGTSLGGIGVFVPIRTHDDLQFWILLEASL
ncbi:MAG: putative cleavage and polyadenylation specificity factor, partial [Streblomastix strix]